MDYSYYAIHWIELENEKIKWTDDSLFYTFNKSSDVEEMKNLIRNQVLNDLIVYPSVDHSSGITAPQHDHLFYSLFAIQAKSYNDRNEKDSAIWLLQKLIKHFQGSLPPSPGTEELGPALLEIGMKEEAEKLLNAYIERLYRNYVHPNAREGYIPRGQLKSYLNYFVELYNSYDLNNVLLTKLFEQIKD